MRGDARAHELIAPGSLSAVLALLADKPGEWTPIAGGTELMVAHAAGRLSVPRLVSLWGIAELRFIRMEAGHAVIGAGTTFRELRGHAGISEHLPLLAQAASWIGSIANQSRATLGGNLVNGSPAADSSPALLVYDAEIELISVRGTRRIPYSEFHTGYKSNAMSVDELLLAIHIPLRFSQHRQYLRKVGTRRAMAISKVAMAGVALLHDGAINEIRLAAASLAAFPSRLVNTERVLLGKQIDASAIKVAREALLDEARPIDDIRSNAAYRRHVAANLLEEFLRSLCVEASRS